MVMKILILIFFLIQESKITRGHNFTLVKKQSRLDVSFHFPRGPSMFGINYQRSVYMLVVLIMFKNRIDKYLVKAGYTSNKGRLHL